MPGFKFVHWIILAVVLPAALIACEDDAQIASRNVSKAADNFEVQRRVVFMNGITDEYMLEVIGRCSIVEDQGIVRAQLEVTCKTGVGAYKKHFLGLSDNVTYFVEQMEAVEASAYHYRVTFKPQVILPDLDLRIDSGDGPRGQ